MTGGFDDMSREENEEIMCGFDLCQKHDSNELIHHSRVFFSMSRRLNKARFFLPRISDEMRRKNV